MAFESLYQYPEEMKQKHERYERMKDKAFVAKDRDRFITYSGLQQEIVENLVMYRDTVLKPSRFKFQRWSCQKIIDELIKVNA